VLDGAAMALMSVLRAAWGVQQVAIKVANAGISPILQAGLRSVPALLLLWLGSHWRCIALLRCGRRLGPDLLAGFLFAGEFALLDTASVVALAVHFVRGTESLAPRQWAGLVCAFAGVVCVLGESVALPGLRRSEITLDLQGTAGFRTTVTG
jgi:drug/metabolite transporter (DMT)-like permease